MATATESTGTTPFQYPLAARRRRHGSRRPLPIHKEHGKYRQHLRDEFDFICVYCLWRETWCMGDGAFEIDHYHPLHPSEKLAAEEEARRRSYRNLVYACRRCNRLKSNHMPKCLAKAHPEQFPLGQVLRVEPDGSITAIEGNPRGIAFIELLHLADEGMTARRRHLIERFNHLQAIRNTDALAQQQFVEAFGLPPSLFMNALMRRLPKEKGVHSPWVTKKRRPEWIPGPHASASPSAARQKVTCPVTSD